MTTLSLKRIAVLALPMAALAMTTSAQAQEWTPSKSIEFIAPANPGGGWDTLVRTMSRVIQQESLADESFAAINVPGGGGSAPGSMDHISIAGLASAAGMEASAVNYIPFSGGGDAMTNLMGGHIEAVIGGAGEAVGQLGEGSQLRALGVSSEERLGGGLADVPTYQEQGYDYTFDIWRGVMGAPEMPEEAVEYYETLFAEMLETDAWREASDQLGWIDAYQDSETFGAFLDDQQEQFSSVLTDLGLLRQ